MTAAIYCRLSREDEDRRHESESIQNQKSLLIGYALEQGWEIYNIYSDEDYSGADAQRPGFRRMIESASHRQFDIILCKSQSRFTRDMELVERSIHGLFPRWGIRFVAVLDNIDTQNRGGKKARQINGLVNEWYLEDLSENIKMVLDHKRKSGRFVGSSPPFGYTRSPDDKNTLAPEGEQAGVVRRIYARCMAGAGAQQIADELNSGGVKSPGVYKGKGGEWSRTAVLRILRDRTYTGALVQGKSRKISYKSADIQRLPPEEWTVVPGTHEAIIAPEIYERIQATLPVRQRRLAGNDERHFLSGRVFCARCGRAMHINAATYNGVRREYVRCRGGGQCEGASLRLDMLARAVYDEAERVLLAGQDALCAVRRAKALLTTPDDTRPAAREISRLAAQITRRENALRELYLDRAEGAITPERFKLYSAQYREEIDSLHTRRAGLEQRQAMREQEMGPEQASELLRAGLQSHIGALLSRVEIGMDEKRNATVTILWNP